MRKLKTRGLTLVEIIIVLAIVATLAGLSLYSLQSGKSKAPSRSVATVLAEEFRAARQAAIASGHPVAIGIPTAGGTRAATSLYRLEGWNVPEVHWSRDYGSEYPGIYFAAASFSTPMGTHTDGVDSSAFSKFSAFDIVDWVPAKFVGDSIFCFTPDGGLVTGAVGAGLPALNNEYTIVVGRDATFSPGANGFVLTSATNPVTLAIGAFGGIKVHEGLLGGSIGPGTASGAPAPVQGDWTANPGGADQIILSNVMVTPQAAGGADGRCQPGQTVTLEVLAYSPQGVELFARWKQGRGSNTNTGFFTYPQGKANVDGALKLVELDRMEYLPKYIPSQFPQVTWTGASPPSGGVFRARWSWTVPLNSTPGEVYHVGVDVQNYKGDATIVNQPSDPLPLVVPPPGRLIVEVMEDGRRVLKQMNLDGSTTVTLTPPGVEEFLPSIDSEGVKLAFLRKSGTGRVVVVRNLEDDTEKVLTPSAGPYTSVSISPDANWVSYRDNAANELINRNLGNNGRSFKLAQNWTGTGHGVRKSRTGWSPDSRYLVFEHGDAISACDLKAAVPKDTAKPILENISQAPYMESPYCPTIYTQGGSEYMLFSLGNKDPVLKIAPFDPDPSAPLTGTINDFPGVTGLASGATDDDYPSVALDGSLLILTRGPESVPGPGEDMTGQTMVQLRGTSGGNFQGPGEIVPGALRGFVVQ